MDNAHCLKAKREFFQNILILWPILKNRLLYAAQKVMQGNSNYKR